jgi:F-type H+-transporting ATPase subunit gamma
VVSLKALKSRTSSIKSIKKITHVMKLVSVSKLKKARDIFEQGQGYTVLINEILESVFNQIDPDTRQVLQEKLPMLVGRNYNTCLLIAIGSDRGLCSSFNNNLAKEVRKCALELIKAGKGVSILCIGSEMRRALGDIQDVKIELLQHSIKSMSEVEELVQAIINRFTNNELDVCDAYYTAFISPVVQQVTSKTLVPLHPFADTKFEPAEDLKSTTFECEPDELSMLKDLTTQVLADGVRSIILEANASEHAARMTAMDNASNNASDIMDSLTSMYNKKRQSGITTELIEIISSSEAMR